MREWTNIQRGMQIRELQKGDLKTRVEWMNDPRVYSSMHFDVPILLDNTLKWFDRIITNDKRSDVVFTIDETIVAFGGLTSITDNPRLAELYIFVDPSSQCKGVGSMATSLLCDWGFSRLGLHKIYLMTNEDNISAIKVYQKCGFQLEGRHRQEYVGSDGNCRDRLYFGLLKTEFNHEPSIK